MKILIEIPPQFPKRGIGVYAENLIQGLEKIDKKNEYILFTWFFRNYAEKLKKLYCPNQNNFSLMVKKFPDSLMTKLEWEIGMPIIKNLLKKEKVNIYHSPGPRLPKFKNVKRIITVHDLIPEIHPEWANTEFIAANKTAILGADAIIADSRNTKADILKFYNLPENKISVIYLGVNAEIFHPVKDKERLDRVKKRRHLPEKFILDIGPFEPRRNAVGLLKAYKKVKEKNPEYKLVLVGIPTRELTLKIRDLNLSQDIISTGYVLQDDLVCIYNLADVFVHPSFYEGFGLQILEAMACGCPVITSNTSSLPEIAGDAGILLNPNSIDDMAEKIGQAVSNEALRNKLSFKGIERAAKFSWQDTAKKTLEIYKNP